VAARKDCTNRIQSAGSVGVSMLTLAAKTNASLIKNAAAAMETVTSALRQLIASNVSLQAGVTFMMVIAIVIAPYCSISMVTDSR